MRKDNPIDPWLVFELLKAKVAPENLRSCYEALAVRDNVPEDPKILLQFLKAGI